MEQGQRCTMPAMVTRSMRTIWPFVLVARRIEVMSKAGVTKRRMSSSQVDIVERMSRKMAGMRGEGRTRGISSDSGTGESKYVD